MTPMQFVVREALKPPFVYVTGVQAPQVTEKNARTTQSRVMSHLIQHPDGATAEELIEATGAAKTAIRAALQRYRDCGMVGVEYRRDTGPDGRQGPRHAVYKRVAPKTESH